jgi:toxin ParE1/3/4
LKVSFTPRAEADLEAVYAYIAVDDEKAAKRVATRILQAIMRLERFPELGRIGRVAQTRELPITGLHYFAVYRPVGNDEIEIVAIVHARRRFPAGDKR